MTLIDRMIEAHTDCAADFLPCGVCGGFPLIIRKAGSPIVSVVHRSEKGCNVTISAFPEATARARWRQQTQE